mmetsp:Transcript_20296/g.26335  ORF Transcript_20296/g.26335 Transcript_20296/m.26335 type:complete len:101 (-) Transcript_20296:4-306(-)
MRIWQNLALNFCMPMVFLYRLTCTMMINPMSLRLSSRLRMKTMDSRLVCLFPLIYVLIYVNHQTVSEEEIEWDDSRSERNDDPEEYGSVYLRCLCLRNLK